MKTGEAILQRPGTLDVEYVKVNFMKLPETAESDDAVTRLLQRNFESDFLISTEQARKEHEQCLDGLTLR
ncbi:class I SAM-dependent methyltransferase [Planctomycetes bacterium CA13]